MLRTSSSSAARSVRATPRARWPTATRAWAAPRPPLSSASSSSSAWLPEYTWRTSRPSPRRAGATAARQDGGAGRRLRGAAGHKGRRPRVQAPPPTPPPASPASPRWPRSSSSRRRKPWCAPPPTTASSTPSSSSLTCTRAAARRRSRATARRRNDGVITRGGQPGCRAGARTRLQAVRLGGAAHRTQRPEDFF
ncbi:hypothetical protein BS78_K095700 [Paspalum vaginatum]|uniref:Uncharacterized protein n=1 Tax=Paspalum vaginatum TaxID=158149 RepID=A0A9W7X926_9POAL|nr:hypothetical protein BS78_K095700 [Paspalum vaginatum]